ncbi:hypothetical protein ACFZAE_08535 [Streptomyces scabiei]
MSRWRALGQGPPDSTLLLCTDGLIEIPGSDLDTDDVALLALRLPSE